MLAAQSGLAELLLDIGVASVNDGTTIKIH